MIHSVVRNYKIISKLGEGGMGEVWLGEHVQQGFRVAIKRLAQHLRQSPDFTRLFLHEAQSQAHLVHPYIIKVLDFFIEEDQYFLVTEYCRGYNLHELLQAKGSLPVKDALNIIKPALSALNYAHSRGVIHRDIKPANLMVSQDMEAKIMDFGLASVAGLPASGSEQFVIGSPHYMSPEQIRNPSIEDHRLDLYAMGIVLYEMITGRVPFEGATTRQIWDKHLNDHPRDPRHLNPSVSRTLNQTILKVLEKDPGKRFAGCGEFREFLEYAEQETETRKQAEKKHVSRPVHGAKSNGKTRVVAARPPQAASQPTLTRSGTTAPPPGQSAPPPIVRQGRPPETAVDVKSLIRNRPGLDKIEDDLIELKGWLAEGAQELQPHFAFPAFLLLAYLVAGLMGIFFNSTALPLRYSGILDLFYKPLDSSASLQASVFIFAYLLFGLMLAYHAYREGTARKGLAISLAAGLFSGPASWFLVFKLALPGLLLVAIKLDLLTLYYQKSAYSGSRSTDLVCALIWLTIIGLMAALSALSARLSRIK